jgi:multidrug efflux system outer membrane protein
MNSYKSMRGWGRAAASSLLMLLLVACSVEPTYKRPDAPTPVAFKEAPVIDAKDAGTWMPAQPADDAHRGEWWTIFGDATLNDLEKQAADANQDLKAAAARVQQSRALQQSARSAWFPQIDARTSLAGIARPAAECGRADANGMACAGHGRV